MRAGARHFLYKERSCTIYLPVFFAYNSGAINCATIIFTRTAGPCYSLAYQLVDR